jgi:predicted ATPase
MLMITGLAIANFKNLARIPAAEGELLPVGPLNVLIGPNGSGKSSFLQAIDFLRAFFRSSVEVYLQEQGWDYRDLPNLRQTGKAIRWEVQAELDADEHGHGAGHYGYTVELQPRKHLGIGVEVLVWKPHHGEPVKLLLRKGRTCSLLNRSTDALEEFQVLRLPASVMSRWESRDRARYPEAMRFRDWVERFRSYLIWDPKVLRHPDRGRHDEIGQSGEHLASVLGHLKDKNRPAFDKLVRRLRRLFPTLSDISVSGGGWGWRTIRLHEGNGRAVVFNSQQMSDGVLRLLAVTSLLYLDRIPTVLTFEEPENGVHPQLIREVVQILRELTQRKPPNRCQAFMTTHSPYVLDEFFDHPEQVYCMDRPQPQAGASVVRLSENKQLKIARDTFKQSLGEAWTSGLLGATAGVTHS